ncbi:O-acetyltransferase OatA [Roseibium album]|nr:O-acetyltransferase OatA [Roseibium album]
MKYRADIDGLRAIAVMSVVIFHAKPKWLPGGFVGVDIFFVISGFLISGIIFDELNAKNFSFSSFYARRIRRIFPALLIVVATCTLFGWFSLLPSEFAQLGKHAVAGTLFVSNFVFWQESGYFDTFSESKPLLHLWSLAVEEQFYILWPIVLWLASNAHSRFLMATLVLWLISFSINLVLTQSAPNAAFFLPFGRLWELLSGALIAWLLLYKGREFSVFKSSVDKLLTRCFRKQLQQPDGIYMSHVLSILGLASVIFSIFHIEENFSFPGVWAALPVGGAMLIIAAGPTAIVNRIVLANRSAVWFGLISYPLYLWHWPLLSYFWIVEGAAGQTWERLILVAVSVLFAWVTYKLVEIPIRVRFNKGAAVRWLVLASGLTVVAGWHVTYFSGIQGRKSVEGYHDSTQELQRTPQQEVACHRFINVSEPLFPYCRLRDVGSKQTIAIIGDSHAHVSFPGIADGFAARGINTILLANSGCPPLLGHETGTTEPERKECRSRIDQILEIITSRLDIHSVIFITRGPVYWTGYEPLAAVSQRELGKGSLSIESFFAGTQATIDLLQKAEIPVYYVTENPELNVRAEYCIKRPLRRNRPQCILSREDVLKRQKHYLNLSAKIKNARILISFEAFCPENTCKIYDKGQLLYADDDHLSISGSFYQYEKLIRSAIAVD